MIFSWPNQSDILQDECNSEIITTLTMIRMIEIEQHQCFNCKILQSIHTRSKNRRIFLCRHKKLASPKNNPSNSRNNFCKKIASWNSHFFAKHLEISLEDDLGLLLSYIFFQVKNVMYHGFCHQTMQPLVKILEWGTLCTFLNILWNNCTFCIIL